MPRYQVTWSMEYDTEYPDSAMSQAWDTIVTIADTRAGPTIFIVHDTETGKRFVYDVENTGFCDDCDRAYLLASAKDHCTNCGRCINHCDGSIHLRRD